MSIIALDKVARLFRIISQHGGLINSFLDLWRHDTLKEGMLVGMDSMGNKYYQNCNYMLARNRWVIYNPIVKFEYDASQVSPEWFGWLHHKTDCKPCEDHAKYLICCCCWYHRWLLPYEENATGTDKAYYPYSTVQQPMSVWDDIIFGRECGVHDLNRSHSKDGEFHKKYEKYRMYPDKFFEYSRMSVETFDYILVNIKPELEKKMDANRILSAAEKLFLTLRWQIHTALGMLKNVIIRVFIKLHPMY